MLMYSTGAFFLSLLSLPQLIASLTHFQPEPTNSSLHGFQSDGSTPKPTSAPNLFIQKRQYHDDNVVCGVLKDNSGMKSPFFPLGFNRTNITQSIWIILTPAKLVKHVYMTETGGDVATRQAVVNGNVPQSRPVWDMSNVVCVVKTVRWLQTS
jgi:hypothetical protein